VNRSEEKLGTAPLLKLVFSLGIPAVMAQLVNLLYSIVDRVYIGHIPEVGALALTGVGLCSPILLIVSAFSAFVGMGGAPLAAMELGRGDREKASRIMNNGLVVLLVFSVLLPVVLMATREPLLRFFGASDDTIGYADSYLCVYLCGTVFVQLSMGLNSFISSQGQAKRAMLSTCIGAVCNIVLDPIFIFALDMGVRGAALATILSQAVSAVWILSFLLSEKSAIRISRRLLKPNMSIILKIAALGVSPFVIQSTESIISIVFQNGLQRYGGDLYVGSYTILSSVMQLMVFPASGFAYGTQPIVSYNYGAGNYERVKNNFKIVASVCAAYTLVFYIFCVLFPGTIAGLFTSDAALAGLTARKMPLYFAGMFIFGIQMSVQATVQGIGQAKISVLIACMRKIILLTPLALILPIFMGVNGIYVAEPISDFLSVTISTCLYVYVCRTKLRTKQ